MQLPFERFTDAWWEVIKPFLNWQRKRKLDLWGAFDAILYVTRIGIQFWLMSNQLFGNELSRMVSDILLFRQVDKSWNTGTVPTLN